MRAVTMSMAFAVCMCLGLPTQSLAKPPSAAAAQPSAAAAAAPAASTSSSTASFESQMLAYAVVDKLAADIADDVCNNVQPVRSTNALRSLVIYDQASFANILTYGAFEQNALIVGDAYDKLGASFSSNLATNPNFTSSVKTGSFDKFLNDQRTLSTAPAGSGTSVSESFSFSPVTDLVTLVSALATSSNTETYGPITIPDSAVAVAIAQRLRARADCQLSQVVYPPVFGSGSASYSPASDIQAITSELNAAKWNAHRTVDGKLIGATLPAGAPATTVQQSTEYAAELTDVDGLYDNLINSLIQPNATTGITGTVSIAQGDTLTQLIDGPLDATGHVVIDDAGKPTASARGAYILLATVVAAGGTVRDHKSFWTNLTTGDDIQYSGGVVVAVSLWDLAAAKPFFSENFRCRAPLTREEDLAKLEISCTRTSIPARASQVRYFWVCPEPPTGMAPASGCGSPDDFVIALSSQAQLQKADDILAGKITDAVHPAGDIVSMPEWYNGRWRFHLRSGSITFGAFSNPTCWSFTTSEINSNLDKVGTPNFLPLKAWCPRGYRLAKEVAP